jgi:hypothetical protein
MDTKMTIREAAEDLGIKYSTAKTIVRIFKTKGRISKKKKNQESEPKCAEMVPATKRPLDFTVDDGEARHMVDLMLSAAEGLKAPRFSGLNCPSHLPSGFWMEKLTEHLVIKNAVTQPGSA